MQQMGQAGRSRGTTARQQLRFVPLLCCALSWMFLWTYWRCCMLAPSLLSAPLENSGVAYLAQALFIPLCAAAISLGKGYRAGKPAPAGWLMAACLLSSASMAALTFWLCDAQPSSEAGALTLICMAVWSVSVAWISMLWVRESWRQAFSFGLEVEIVAVTVGFVLSFAVVGTGDTASTGARVLWSAGTTASAALLLATARLGRAQAGAPNVQDDASEPMAGRMVPWLIPIAVALLAVNLLGFAYSYLPIPGYAGVSKEPLMNAMTLVVLVVISGFAVAVAHMPRKRRGALLACVLMFFVAAVVACFALALATMLNSQSANYMAILVRRISKTTAFVAILAITYQANINPGPAFSLALLLPVMPTRPASLLIAGTVPQLSGGMDDGLLLTALLGMGFVLVLFLIAYCLINLDGRLTRMALLDEDSEKGATGERNEMEARLAACERIAQTYGLTSRERDVLLFYSQGMSAKDTALELSLSLGTINTHASTLYGKLGVHSKQEVADLVAAQRAS